MTDNKLIIKKLTINDSEEINQVNEILCNWWGEEEGFSKEAIKQLIETRCMSANLPVVFIATIEKNVVGTISLVANDIGFRQDLYPVITSFFVKEEYRNLGIGRKLMQRMIKHCENKFDTIYLATELNEFYEKFGFEYVETCKCYYNLKENKIMCGKIYKFHII